MKVQKKVKVEVLTQLLDSIKSDKVQVMKCPLSVKVKIFPLKDISTDHFCTMITEPHVISIQCKGRIKDFSELFLTTLEYLLIAKFNSQNVKF